MAGLFRTVLTEELVERIGQAIETPANTGAAVGSLGVSASAFHSWMRKGARAPDTVFGRLRRRVQLAEANRELHLTELVYQGASQDAKWAAWLLERLYPEKWGPYAVQNTQGDIDDMLGLDPELDLSALTDEEIRTVAAAGEILARIGGDAEDGSIPARAREARSNRVHQMDIPELPSQLAPPFDREEA